MFNMFLYIAGKTQVLQNAHLLRRTVYLKRDSFAHKTSRKRHGDRVWSVRFIGFRLPLSSGYCFRYGDGRIGLDFAGHSGYKQRVEQGAPILAEKIPFEPDLGNASVGNGE